MTRRKRANFSKRQIAEYWDGHPGLKSTLEDCCWCCGIVTKRIERAHILPLSLGGPDTLDNIHLLCAVCHVTTEDLYGDAYWAFLKATPDRLVARVVESAKALKAAGHPDFQSFDFRLLGEDS